MSELTLTPDHGLSTEKPEGAGYRYGAIRTKREWGLNLEKEEHGVECLNIILIKVNSFEWKS
jgi:hypothetical protein